ncbi:unnamed protein product [Brassica napus]|uniref:(rape) hypothetical protein n=1 Tax=Brassica napus TaxID=3708 RepID=A0A816JZM5_BRANA|nr:unnamed protein product [Brassica napus]
MHDPRTRCFLVNDHDPPLLFFLSIFLNNFPSLFLDNFPSLFFNNFHSLFLFFSLLLQLSSCFFPLFPQPLPQQLQHLFQVLPP